MTSDVQKRVLVTGGAGFIGSHIVRRMLREGFKVRVLDDFSSGKPENLRDLPGEIELLKGCVSDSSTARRAVEDVDCVFHHAAIASVAHSVREPLHVHQINATGTLVMLQAAKTADVTRFVYAASSSAYGDALASPQIETLSPRPLSPYAVAKLSGEYYCGLWHRVYGLETIALRYFNVFGPRQDPQSEYAAVIPRFICALLEGREITIYGDGEQSRDFTHVSNIVEANWRAMSSICAGEIYNIACGERVTLNEVVKTLGEIIGVTPCVGYAVPRAGDIRHSLASIDRARSELGYRPTTNFRAGLEETVAHFQTFGC